MGLSVKHAILNAATAMGALLGNPPAQAQNAPAIAAREILELAGEAQASNAVDPSQAQKPKGIKALVEQVRSGLKNQAKGVQSGGNSNQLRGMLDGVYQYEDLIREAKTAQMRKTCEHHRVALFFQNHLLHDHGKINNLVLPAIAKEENPASPGYGMPIFNDGIGNLRGVVVDIINDRCLAEAPVAVKLVKDSGGLKGAFQHNFDHWGTLLDGIQANDKTDYSVLRGRIDAMNRQTNERLPAVTAEKVDGWVEAARKALSAGVAR